MPLTDNCLVLMLFNQFLLLYYIQVALKSCYKWDGIPLQLSTLGRELQLRKVIAEPGSNFYMQTQVGTSYYVKMVIGVLL